MCIEPEIFISDPINYDCCSVNLKDTPSCYPVDVPEQDPFYKELNVTCLSVEGTVPCFNCRLGEERHGLRNTLTSCSCSPVDGIFLCTSTTTPCDTMEHAD